MRLLVFYVLFLVSALCYVHVSHGWSWAGVYELPMHHEEGEEVHEVGHEHEEEEHVVQHVIMSFEKTLSTESYAASSMKIYITYLPSASEEAIGAKGKDVEELFESNEASITKMTLWNSTSMNHANIPHNEVVQLQFNDESWITSFSLTFPIVEEDAENKYLIIFSELDPHDFHLHAGDEEEADSEEDTYFIRDVHGHAYRPLVEVEGSHDAEEHAANVVNSKKWGQIMGGVIVVWLVTFIGLIFVLVPLKIQQSQTVDWYLNYWGKKFAAGALLGTAFNLILLESSSLIATKDGGNIEESQVAGYWGAMVLCGFATAFIVELIFDAIIFQISGKATEPAIVPANSNAQIPQHTCEKGSFPIVSAERIIDPEVGQELSPQEEKAIVAGGTEKSSLEMTQESSGKTLVIGSSSTTQSFSEFMTPLRIRIISAILVGDFFHNFCDGIFIGAAFISCGTSFGWTVATVSIFHEIIQELADYLVLTKVASLTTPYAILCNAISGISVILGGICIAAASQISNFSIGMLLAFGAGQYIFVATVELLGNDAHVHHGSSIADPSSEVESHDHDHKRKIPTYFDRIMGLLFFCLAAVAVGLVLLNHNHCESESSSNSTGHQH